MPDFKHKKTGEVITVSKLRMIFKESGEVEHRDINGKYDLSKYDHVPIKTDFQSIRVVPNANDSFKLR